MKPFTGYEAKRSTREQIPVGGYIVKILDAEEVHYTWGRVLMLRFDIAEGDYQDYFKKEYKDQTREDKKWQGVYRLYVPKEDGSQEDGWTKNTFNGVMFAFEDSNLGFHWDWDETKLKGLTVGALFRNEEWEYDGRTGWKTKCCSLIPVEDVRQKRYNMPKDKPLPPAKKPASTADFEEITDDDLPFTL